MGVWTPVQPASLAVAGVAISAPGGISTGPYGELPEGTLAGRKEFVMTPAGWRSLGEWALRPGWSGASIGLQRHEPCFWELVVDAQLATSHRGASSSTALAGGGCSALRFMDLTSLGMMSQAGTFPVRLLLGVSKVRLPASGSFVKDEHPCWLQLSPFLPGLCSAWHCPFSSGPPAPPHIQGKCQWTTIRPSPAPRNWSFCHYTMLFSRYSF